MVFESRRSSRDVDGRCTLVTISLRYAEFANVLDPAGWDFAPTAVNYHELYDVSSDYYMMVNIWADAGAEQQQLLHEKLERAFRCKGRAECNAA